MNFKAASRMLRESAAENGHDMEMFSGHQDYRNAECKYCGE